MRASSFVLVQLVGGCLGLSLRTHNLEKNVEASVLASSQSSFQKVCNEVDTAYYKWHFNNELHALYKANAKDVDFSPLFDDEIFQHSKVERAFLVFQSEESLKVTEDDCLDAVYKQGWKIHYQPPAEAFTAISLDLLKRLRKLQTDDKTSSGIVFKVFSKDYVKNTFSDFEKNEFGKMFTIYPPFSVPPPQVEVLTFAK